MNRLVRIGAVLAFLLIAAPAGAGEPQEELSLDQAFEQLKAYEYGQSRRPLAMLELEIPRATADPARKVQVADRLAAVLTDPKATVAAKRFACQQLQIVGTEVQVPVLAKMLDDAQTADMARTTLEGIPGEASVKVLRAALDRFKGPALVGLVNSLGNRGDAKATAALAKLVGGSDAGVAAAAATALGKIGTADAAAGLEKAGGEAELLAAIRDARLRCAEQLAAAGNAAGAEAIYRRMWAADESAPWRAAALAGMARVGKDAALPLVLEALRSGDPLLTGTAAALARQMPGAAVTAALAAELEKLPAAGQAALVETLAARGDRAAGPAVQAILSAKDPAVVSAAVSALGVLGGEDSVQPLCHAADAWPNVRAAARTALARLDAPGVDARLRDLAARHDGGVQAEAVRALGARRTASAGRVLLEAVDNGDERVSAAALEALAAAGGPEEFAVLVRMLTRPMLAEAACGPMRDAVETAAAGIGSRMTDQAARAAPVLAAMKSAPAAVKPALLRLLAAGGGPQALEAVRGYLKDNDAAVREAAVRALAAWPDDGAAADLLGLAKDSDNATHRVLALRGYLRLAVQNKDEAARLKMLSLAREVAQTAEAKKMLLAGLAGLADPEALALAESFLKDAEVKAEAALAVEKIRQGMKPKPGGGSAALPPYDKKRSAAQKQELAKRAPRGFHLACYLDCGPDTVDGKQGAPMLRLVSGTPYLWAGAETLADIRFGTVAFDGREVVFEAAGLDPERTYRLGFSWWDYDQSTRAQSVWASPKAGGQPVQLLEKTQLPSGAQGRKPDEKTVPLPRDLTAAGTVRILFRNEASPNAVVSEVWLWESGGTSEPRTRAAEPPAPATAKVDRSSSKAEVRALMVTGVDYPGHKWCETAPVLRKTIEKDGRLAVDVVEDPAWLASGALNGYKVLIHHWMNWEVPAPGTEARENFARFVRDGGGLVLVHFACGAWQDWPEFERIAGRVWNPKLRGHDPRGSFTVEIVDAAHPITRGMKAFQTVDELYTCLDGETPVHVLAKATSKVDKKDYPIAFVLTYGKGRVFHCVLGHDVRAFETPEVVELFRRGTAWAAGLEPTPGNGGREPSASTRSMTKLAGEPAGSLPLWIEP